MALKYGDSMPSAIKYNGQDVKIVKYGTQAVWGKYYTLNMSVPQNIEVTVTRVSSPNQHGYTALLTNNSTIYLRIISFLLNPSKISPLLALFCFLC